MTNDVEKIITAGIRFTLDRWLKEGLASDPCEINTGAAKGGTAEDFARHVVHDLGDLGFLPARLHITMLSQDWDAPETIGSPFDRTEIARHYPSSVPPEGMDWDDLTRMSADLGFTFESHVWLNKGDRHYDAECPEGVANLFDLPFFKRAVATWVAEHKAPPSP